MCTYIDINIHKIMLLSTYKLSYKFSYKKNLLCIYKKAYKLIIHKLLYIYMTNSFL